MPVSSDDHVKSDALWHSAVRSYQRLLPFVEPIREQIVASDGVCTDETPIKLLTPGCPEATTAYLWTTVGDAAHPYNAFFFTEEHSRAGPEEILGHCLGKSVSDAYESLQSAWSDRMQWRLVPRPD